MQLLVGRISFYFTLSMMSLAYGMETSRTVKPKEETVAIVNALKACDDNQAVNSIEQFLEKYPQDMNNVIRQDDEGTFTLLTLAVANNRPTVGHWLINHGADINIQDPLHTAAIFNSLDAMKLLVDYGAQVNQKVGEFEGNWLSKRIRGFKHFFNLETDGDSKFTPLHSLIYINAYPYASNPSSPRYNYHPAMRFLIDHGADVNARTDNLDTPLHLIVKYNDTQGARILLDKGANPLAKNKQGLTPLALAKVYHENRNTTGHSLDEIIQFLSPYEPEQVSLPVEPSVEQRKPIEPAPMPVEQPKEKPSILPTPEVGEPISKERPVLPLEQIPVTVPKVPKVNQGLQVFEAIRQNDPNVLALVQDYLRKFPAAINKDVVGTGSFLLIAVEQNNYTLVVYLLDQGADVNGVGNEFKETALAAAVRRNYAVMVQLLLDRGADVNVQDHAGNTPLTLAVSGGASDIAKLLLDHGANPHTVQKSSWQLVEAQGGGQKAALLALLEPYTKSFSQPKPNRFFFWRKPVSSGSPPGAPGRGTDFPTGLQQSSTIFNRRNLIIAALGTLASGGFLYKYLTYQEVPTILDKDVLCEKLTQALINKEYHYAYQLALKNPQAVQALRADSSTAKHDIEQLIEQAELALINDTAAESLTMYQRLIRPSTSEQLKDLADLGRLLDRS